MNSVSVIIAAYNEGPRISQVLKPLLNHPLIKEIIVVNDCSNDNTASVIRTFPAVKLITTSKNIGKNACLLKAVLKSRGNILLFLDADLIGLTEQTIADLVKPIINQSADLTMSYRDGDSFFFKYIILASPFTSGERCMYKKDYLQIQDLRKANNFEFELLVNKYFLEQHKKITVIYTKKLKNTMKFQKRGIINGWREDITMSFDLFKKFGLVEILKQAIIISYGYQLRRLFLSHKTICIT